MNDLSDRGMDWREWSFIAKKVCRIVIHGTLLYSDIVHTENTRPDKWDRLWCLRMPGKCRYQSANNETKPLDY